MIREILGGTDQRDLTTGNACWETAPRIYQAIADSFGPFDVDICADARRNLAPVWFGPDSPVGELDALTADWARYGSRGFGNPPYGAFIGKVLPRAIVAARHGFASAHLIPLRITKAFKSHIMPGAAEVHICDSRLVFFENGVPRCSVDKRGNLRPDPAMFDSIIVRYLPGPPPAAPAFKWWKVPPHVTPADIERAAARRAALKVSA